MKEDTTPIDPTWMEKTGGFARDMTVRDYYAGQVVPWFLHTLNEENASEDPPMHPQLLRQFAAESAYKMADAMLRARDAE